MLCRACKCAIHMKNIRSACNPQAPRQRRYHSSLTKKNSPQIGAVALRIRVGAYACDTATACLRRCLQSYSITLLHCLPAVGKHALVKAPRLDTVSRRTHGGAVGSHGHYSGQKRLHILALTGMPTADLHCLPHCSTIGQLHELVYMANA
jgi:hypothetical protein